MGFSNMADYTAIDGERRAPSCAKRLRAWETMKNNILISALAAFQQQNELSSVDYPTMMERARARYAERRKEENRIRESVERKLEIKRRIREHLLKRDGSKCFYCLHELCDDISIEHLLERSRGGNHGYENLRLAHKACNRAVIGLSVMDKLQLRAERLDAQ